MGLVHEQGSWWNKSSSVPLVCLRADLGVKRDAFIIESTPEEEVRESCEGVKSKDKSRYDEKGEAHRSLRRVFDSVLHSIPLLPVAIARKMLVSTKIYSGLSYSNSRSVNMHTSNLNVFMSDTYPDQQQETFSHWFGKVSVLIRKILWRRAWKLLFAHHAHQFIRDFEKEDKNDVGPVNDFIMG